MTEPAALPTALRIARGHLLEIEAACSRFRPASELSRLHAKAAEGPVGRPVSPLLAELVGAALAAARRTGGDVDPTVGGALSALGYDRDYLVLAADGGAVRLVPRRPTWSDVALADGELFLPAGVVLDLGASAKAVAADRCAALVAAQTGAGVMVNRSRTWRRGGLTMHHIVNPRTGLPVERVWRSVSVAACGWSTPSSRSAAATGRATSGWEPSRWTCSRRSSSPACCVAASAPERGGPCTGWPTSAGRRRCCTGWARAPTRAGVVAGDHRAVFCCGRERRLLALHGRVRPAHSGPGAGPGAGGRVGGAGGASD